MTLQLIEGQGSTDRWPHFYLSTGRGERSSSLFKGNVWSALSLLAIVDFLDLDI